MVVKTRGMEQLRRVIHTLVACDVGEEEVVGTDFANMVNFDLAHAQCRGQHREVSIGRVSRLKGEGIHIDAPDAMMPAERVHVVSGGERDACEREPPRFRHELHRRTCAAKRQGE